MKQPHLLVDEGDVNDTVFVPGDPGRVDRIAKHLEDTEVVAENREYKIVNGRYESEEVSVCSTGIGCPSATIAFEELNNVGVEKLIRVGTTGALQEDIEIGDMVVPTAAAKFEGTSKRYEDVEYPAVPSLETTNDIVDAAREKGEDIHVGPIVTDDAFYAEEGVASKWEEKGMVAVEMEAASLFTLGRLKDLDTGAILTVDGNLVLGTQKGETEEDELPEKAKNNVERAIEISLESVV